MSVEKYPNNPIFGRREIVDGKAGQYVWQTYKEVYDLVIKVGNATVVAIAYLMRFFFYRTRSQDFSRSGPVHLTEIDWTNEDYRRSALASLVQGVYVAELDRQENRRGSQALASPWWKSFNFEMLEQLEDDVDSSIFGAKYKFRPPASHLSTDGCPCYVIVFRGTLLTQKTIKRDLELDLKIIGNRLRLDSRFQIAMKTVRDLVASEGSSNVWLVGHSLGSAIALHAGKTMAKEGFPLESFLFNLPYPSVPIEKIIKHEKVEHAIRSGGSEFRARLALAMEEKPGDPFLALSAWVPHIFVNRADCICSGYVGSFEHRKEMKEFGSGGMVRLAMQLSVRGLAMGELSEPMHRIPSAEITVNSTRKRHAHGIKQWWAPPQNLQLESFLYTT